MSEEIDNEEDVLGEMKTFPRRLKTSKRNVINALMVQARMKRTERVKEKKNLVTINKALEAEEVMDNNAELNAILPKLGYLTNMKRVFVDYIKRLEPKDIPEEMMDVLRTLNETSDEDLYVLLLPIYKFRLDSIESAIKLSRQLDPSKEISEYLEEIDGFKEGYDSKDPSLFDAIDIFIENHKSTKGGKTKRKRNTRMKKSIRLKRQ